MEFDLKPFPVGYARVRRVKPRSGSHSSSRSLAALNHSYSGAHRCAAKDKSPQLTQVECALVRVISALRQANSEL